MTSTIVKIQRPPIQPKHPWLIYDQTRAVHLLVPFGELPRRVVADMGEAMKMYYHAALEPDGLHFIRRAEPQNW